jgi:guanylate kinase
VSEPRPLLAVLTGPSAAGKDSVLLRLRPLLPDAHFAITATTRAPRTDERDGVDYYFVSLEEFRRMVAKGEMLENALVYGDHKGVPKGPIREALQAGRDVLMRTDVQGARHIKSVVPGAVTIFVTAPSEAELTRRLLERGADSKEQAELRLRTAKSEMECAGEFDYNVVNDDLDRCTAEVADILERERMRPGRPRPIVA